MIPSCPLIQTGAWITDTATYCKALPAEVQTVLDRAEAEGQENTQAYVDAVDVFYRRHLCRTDPCPPELLRSFDLMNAHCYGAMWGPSEFTCTRVLRDYEGAQALAGIRVSTLVTCGTFEEATPTSTERFAAMIPRAAFEVFATASHLAFIEDRPAYIARLRAFLGDQK